MSWFTDNGRGERERKRKRERAGRAEFPRFLYLFLPEISCRTSPLRSPRDLSPRATATIPHHYVEIPCLFSSLSVISSRYISSNEKMLMEESFNGLSHMETANWNLRIERNFIGPDRKIGETFNPYLTIHVSLLSSINSSSKSIRVLSIYPIHTSLFRRITLI